MKQTECPKCKSHKTTKQANLLAIGIILMFIGIWIFPLLLIGLAFLVAGFFASGYVCKSCHYKWKSEKAIQRAKIMKNLTWNDLKSLPSKMSKKQLPAVIGIIIFVIAAISLSFIDINPPKGTISQETTTDSVTITPNVFETPLTPELTPEQKEKIRAKKQESKRRKTSQDSQIQKYIDKILILQAKEQAILKIITRLESTITQNSLYLL